MVSYLSLAVGIFALWVGWTFYATPQTAFRRRHWPFHPEGNGLTEEGEYSYRVLGVFFLITGVGLVLWGVLV